jgi:TonB-dependent starch-binding outer membrane protein SusC
MRKIILSIIFFLFLFPLVGQRSITGRVIEASNTPLIGASVFLKDDPGKGTITDIDGQFQISVPNEKSIIVVSYTGYTTKEMSTEGITNLEVVLAQGTVLDEIVFIGYGTQRKSKVTGSIASIKGGDIAVMPVQSFDQALQGRASGVQITTPNGLLNNPPVIRVRGTNSINLSSQPLIVIDGVPTFSGDFSSNNASSNVLGNLNPSDIESFEVLKDASASAIYGSRAAAGVLLITTKRGSKGATKVSYDGWVGRTTPVRLFDMLNSAQYLEVKNEALANNNDARRFIAGKDLSGNPVDTRWYDHTHQTGYSHNHNVNFTGGNESTSYFTSIGFSQQEGFLRGNSFDRITGRLNIDHKISNLIKIGANFSIANTTNEGPNSGSNPGAAFGISGLGRLPLVLQPILAPYINKEGAGSQSKGPGFDYNISSTNNIGGMGNVLPSAFVNPTIILDLNTFQSNNLHLIGSTYLDISPLKGLNWRSVIGIDQLNVEDLSYLNPQHGDGFANGGRADNINQTLRRWNLQSTLSYLTNFDKIHDINIMIGMEDQHTERNRWGASRQQVSDPFFTSFQGNYTTIIPLGNLQRENFLTSLFTRVGYTLSNKYFATFNLRRDGYSAFAEGKKYGVFYGGSLGYTISEEGFWKNLFGNKINHFKIRSSYGRVGNSAVADFAALSLYTSALYGTDPVLRFGQAGNSNLTWETSKKIDLGFTIGLLDDKVQVEFSYYKNNVDNLILEVPQSPSKGIPGILVNNVISANSGSMYNKGIEANVTYNVFRNKKFDWSINLNYTTLKNEVLSLGSDNADINTATSVLEVASITRVGQSLGSIYAVPTNGINPSNGRRIFLRRDIINSKPVLVPVQYDHSALPSARWTLVENGLPTGAPSTANSGTVYGPTMPTYFGGLSNKFNYNSIDLEVFFQFSGGNYIYNGTQAGLRDMRNWNNHTDVLDRWTEQNKDGTIPKVVFGDNISNGSALPISENIEKGDFIRLRNVVLGYKLPKSLTKKLNISNLRLYAQMQNALLFTKYSGSDPEISTNGDSNTAPGIDRNTLGQGKTSTVGLQINF